MKTAHLTLPAALKKIMPSIEKVEFPGETLKDVLQALDSVEPGVSQRLLDNDQLRPFLRVYVGEQDARLAGGLDTKVNDKDHITILLSQAGG